MPTNSNYDGYFSGIGGTPIFTYGMITITTAVLAYMTYMDPYVPEPTVPIDESTAESIEPILEATSMDGVADALPESMSPEEQQNPEEQPSSSPDEEQNPSPEEQQNPSPEEQQSPSPEEQQSPSQEEQQSPPPSPSQDEEQSPSQDEEQPPVAGGKRKRSTRRSRPSGKKH